MKREGRQHGNVKAHPNKTARYVEKLPLAGIEIRTVQPRSAPSNGSNFTGKCKKARCKSCHYHPVTKSKDKSKGSYKLKSCDVALNHKLVSWRIAGSDLGMLNYKGVSASSVLKDLSGSIYSSNYSCEEAVDHEYKEREKEVGFDVEFSNDYANAFNNNTINNNFLEASDDFIGFGGLFDEIEFGYNNLVENSDDFTGFGGLFDETDTNAKNLMIEEIIQENGVEESDSNGIEGEKNDLDNLVSENEEEEDEMGFYIVGVVNEFSDNEDWLVVEEI